MHRNIRLLSWFNFCLDFRLYSPIAIIYFSRVAGSYALGASVLGVIMLSAAIFEVPTGVISDKLKRKHVMSLGALASVASISLYAVGGSYAVAGSYKVLVLGAICEGLCRALYSGNNDALLHDTLTEAGKEDEYHEYAGRTKSMYQLALGISAILGGIVAYYSFQAVMWLSVIPQAVSLVLSFFFIEPKLERMIESNIFAHVKDAAHQFFKNKKLRSISLISILNYAIGEASFNFYPVFYALMWPVWAIGVARTIANFAAAASFHFSGRLIKRFGELKLLVTANIYGPGINLVALLLQSVISPILMSTGSLFHGTYVTSMSSLQQKEFTRHQRATMASLSSLGGSLLFAPAAVALGSIADRIGPINALYITETLTLLVALLYIPLMRGKKEIATSPLHRGNIS